MSKNVLELYESNMVKVFGYEHVVHGEEIVLLAAGIFIGMIIMACISANFIRKLYKVDDFGKGAFSMIRVDDGQKIKYTVSFKTFAEAFQQILLLAFSPFFTVKNYTKRDEKRTKRFIRIMFVIGILLTAFAVLSVSTVFQSQF